MSVPCARPTLYKYYAVLNDLQAINLYDKRKLCAFFKRQVKQLLNIRKLRLTEINMRELGDCTLSKVRIKATSRTPKTDHFASVINHKRSHPDVEFDIVDTLVLLHDETLLVVLRT